MGTSMMDTGAALAVLQTFDYNNVIRGLYDSMVTSWHHAVSRDNARRIISHYTASYTHGPLTTRMGIAELLGITFHCILTRIDMLPVDARPVEALRLLQVLHSLRQRLDDQRRIDWQAARDLQLAHNLAASAAERQRNNRATWEATRIAARASAAAHAAIQAANADRLAAEQAAGNAMRKANMTWPGFWPDEEPWDQGF